jgi:hypothetical protein
MTTTSSAHFDRLISQAMAVFHQHETRAIELTGADDLWDTERMSLRRDENKRLEDEIGAHETALIERPGQESDVDSPGSQLLE